MSNLSDYGIDLDTLRRMYDEWQAGVPKGTIMSRLFHARRKMQALLADYLDERPQGEKEGGDG